MPVANLQSYRTVEVRSRTNLPIAQGQAQLLQNWVMQRLGQVCGFERVNPAGTPSDVVLDLNVMNIQRGGGGGWISNPNQALVDVLFVLTDSESGELLASSKVHGKSSGVIMNGAPPENDATEVVAKTIVDTLAKSGCAGPRVAKAPPPPPPGPKTNPNNTTVANNTNNTTANTTNNTTTSPPPPVDEARHAEAEQLNDQGKDKLQVADIEGALALFQQANAKSPEAKYAFNICLSFGSLERWSDADAACKQARSLGPDARLASKIDVQLDAIHQHH